ncbi:MAG: S8 family serine peptidase [Armatimonadota bacterium]
MKAWPFLHTVLLVFLFVCLTGIPALSAPPASVPGQLLVRYQAGSSAAVRSTASRTIEAVVIKEYPRFNLQLVGLPDGMTIEEGITAYRNTPGVTYAEPNYIYKTCAVPNDQMYPSLWGLEKINAPEAWNVLTGAESIVVADIDTGVDYTHPDLEDNMWVNSAEIPGNEKDDDNNGFVDDVYGINAIDNAANPGDPMDDHGHGTHTTGTIGAVGNNQEGITGVNWAVKIMALKFLDDEGVGATSDAITCFEYVLAMKNRGVNIRVTNNSWGGGAPSQALQDAIEACGDAGILNVCAAGNDSVDNDGGFFRHYPSSYDLDCILAVASSDQDDEASWFTNWGATTVDVAAPGSSILSTYPDGRYLFMSGTSMACPHVAGAAALILGLTPGLTVAEVKAQIMNTGDPVSWVGKPTVTNKRLNLKRCLRPFKVNFLMPRQNQVLFVTRPTMIALVEGFNPNTLTVSLDDTPLEAPSYNPATGELTCQLGPLTPGRSHVLKVSGQDLFGGPAEEMMTFWVQSKTFYSGKYMVAFPAVDVGSVPDVFTDITYPRVAVWNPGTLEYEQYPQSFADLNNQIWAATDMVTGQKAAPAGRGFWVDLPSTSRLNLCGDVVRADHPISIPILRGFNMIGNPYTYPIGFGSVMLQYNGVLYSLPEAVQANLIEPVLYRWEGTGYRFDLLPEAVLQPWVGYWILCRANTKVRPMTLIFQPAEAGTARSTEAKATVRAQGKVWEVPINVADLVTNQKATVILGALENATNQTDFGLDIAAPPMSPGGLSVTSRSGLQDEPLLRDYRPLTEGAEYRWEVSVNGTPGSQVVISWPKLTGLPRNYVLTLHDKVTGEDRYMRTSANYTVTLGAQERERQLVITASPGDLGSLRVMNLQGQRTRANGASITCQVTQAANVTVEIRTLAGRLVKRFPVTAFAQGLVNVNWDGADTRGRRVPRGAYLCHVLAETSSGQKATAVTTLPF